MCEPIYIGSNIRNGTVALFIHRTLFVFVLELPCLRKSCISRVNEGDSALLLSQSVPPHIFGPDGINDKRHIHGVNPRADTQQCFIANYTIRPPVISLLNFPFIWQAKYFDKPMRWPFLFLAPVSTGAAGGMK